MRTEDGSIIYTCLNGDTEAFGILVDKYKASIYAYILSKLRSFQDAEDITQEVFLHAYRNLRSLRHWESFAFWLHRIARNLCNKWIRARSRRPDDAFIEDQDLQILEKRSLNAYRDDRTDESLHEALDSLSETYREVLMLYYFGGMTIKDISKAVGASPSAIGKRLSRARSQLREEMIAMMDTAFEGQRLQAGFTFRIVEAVKRIKIEPMPRTAGLPWGLSLAAGIILAVLSLGSHMNLSQFMNAPLDSTLPDETAIAEVGEISVDVLRVSRISTLSGKRGNDYGGGIMPPDQQNAVLLAPRGEGDEWPEEPAARMGKGNINQIAHSPDGKVLAIAGDLGIWLYNASNLDEIGLLGEYAGDVAFSPDGKLLASAQWDNSGVFLWDIQRKKQVGLLKPQFGASDVTSIAFSPDGKLLASGNCDKTVRLWDVDREKQLAVLQGHTGNPSSIVFSPDGKLVASGSYDKTVRLWDVQEQEQAGVLKGHTEAVSSVAFSPDGKLLASGGRWPDSAVRLWDVQGRKQVARLEHESDVYSVAFSPDGKLLASGEFLGKVGLWDVAEQKQVVMLQAHADTVNSLVFSPDGKNLTSSSPSAVRVWDVEGRKQVGGVEGYTGGLYSVAFSPDGRSFASSGEDRMIHLWDVQGQEQVGMLEGHRTYVFSVAFSPDGKLLASGSHWSDRPKAVRLWDVQKQRQVGLLRGHTESVWSVAFSPDGKLLASGGNEAIRLWNVAEQRQVEVLQGHAGNVMSVAFSPDGKLVASGSVDKTVRLWDVQEQKQVGVLHGHAKVVHSVAFSPDGETLASGSRDMTVRLWDVQWQRQVGVLHGHAGYVMSVAFSPDGRWLAAGCGGGVVSIWDVQEQKQVDSLSHAGPVLSVLSVAFSSDGKWLAAAHATGVVSLWEVNVGGPDISVEPMGKQLGTWGNVKKTELLQNFPNPFNPETWIPFSLSEPNHVKIRIYTSTGRLIRTLDLGQKPSGAYLSKEEAAYWDGRNESGETVASDVYFYTLEAGGHIGLKKMILAR
jgi:RNA polymerase sigma factor (sigma-70 family)